MPVKLTEPTIFRRWHEYQRERFPVVAHGLLIAAFSACGVSCSWLLRGGDEVPWGGAFGVAFGTTFLIFLQLRIADEFKDEEEDRMWRPWRPVPRGLVTLRELGWVGVAGAVIQALLAIWHDVRLLPVLLATWLWLALMAREFFVGEWLRARPVMYLWTHLLIIPITDFYATACEWLPAGVGPPRGLWWFIAVSFGNGLTLEIGRKLRVPCDEQEGVRTYSGLWGMRRASLVWLVSMVVTGGFAVGAAREIGTALVEVMVLVPVLAWGVWSRWRYLETGESGAARRVERVTSLWTLVLYFSIGIVPLVVRLMGGVK